MLLFPYNSKTMGERPKWISDSDSTSKNKNNLTKPNLLITCISCLSNTLYLFLCFSRDYTL